MLEKTKGQIKNGHLGYTSNEVDKTKDEDRQNQKQDTEN
jgi:hypothetical protein